MEQGPKSSKYLIGRGESVATDFTSPQQSATSNKNAKANYFESGRSLPRRDILTVPELIHPAIDQKNAPLHKGPLISAEVNQSDIQETNKTDFERQRGRQTSDATAPEQPVENLFSDDCFNVIPGIETDYGRLQQLMNDPEIEEIWLNSPNRIFFAKSGISQLSNVVMTAEEVRALIERLLMWGGRRLDLTNPFVDARLPDGSRLHVAIPEVTAKHWAINIRKHLVRGSSLSELVELGVLSNEVKEFLQECVIAGKNILVSGSTQAGKTTLLNALISAAPNKSRVITIEEVFELRLKVADCVALQTRSANLQGEGEIPLRRLIKEALRMRPSRLVVGEIREAESLDLLIALNSGLPGAATIHANSAHDAISKLQTLPLLAGENISHRFITPVVASAIDLVVHISLDTSGKRTITQILALTGRVEGDRIETEPVFTLYSKDEVGRPKYLRGIGRVEGIESNIHVVESTSHIAAPKANKGTR